MKWLDKIDAAFGTNKKTGHIGRRIGGTIAALTAPVWFGAVAMGIYHTAAEEGVQSFAQKHAPSAVASFVMNADMIGKRVGAMAEAAPYIWHDKTRAMVGVSSLPKEGLISYEVAITKPELNGDWEEIGSAVCSYSAYVKQDRPVITDVQTNDHEGQTLRVVNNRMLDFFGVGSGEMLSKPVSSGWDDKKAVQLRFLSEQQTAAFYNNMRGFCGRVKEAVSAMGAGGNTAMYNQVVVVPTAFEDIGREIIDLKTGALLALGNDAVPSPTPKTEQHIASSKKTKAAPAPAIALTPVRAPVVSDKSVIIEGAEVILRDQPKTSTTPKATPKRDVQPKSKSLEKKGKGPNSLPPSKKDVFEKNAPTKGKRGPAMVAKSEPARVAPAQRPVHDKTRALATALRIGAYDHR